jgi:hypothetical protein
MVPASGWVRVGGWGGFEQVGSVGKSQWEAIVYGEYDVTCHLDSSAAMMTDRDLRRHGPFCVCASYRLWRSRRRRGPIPTAEVRDVKSELEVASEADNTDDGEKPPARPRHDARAGRLRCYYIATATTRCYYYNYHLTARSLPAGLSRRVPLLSPHRTSLARCAM